MGGRISRGEKKQGDEGDISDFGLRNADCGMEKPNSKIER